MPDILHRVGIKSSQKDAYRALTTIEGLAGWWTSTTRGDAKAGGNIHFQFGEKGYFDIEVRGLEPEKSVLWEVTGGPEEWIGTKISFDLKREDDYTVVLFKHQGWKEPIEFMHHCSTKWAVFLMSLKSLLETGRGAAFPNDVKIDNYN